MRSNLKFRKGEFITQNSCPNSFAIFGGEAYDPVKAGDGMDYSLICYSNPQHFTKEGEKWIHESIFEYDLEETNETCEYTINESDKNYWRTCTQGEIDNALKFLASKHLAWVEEDNKFRKLGANERIVFGTEEQPKNTGVPGGNVRYNGRPNTPGIVNPYYSNRNIGFTPSTKTTKMITRVVKDDWEQKEPITTMTVEHKEMVMIQCDKLKYAFDSYQVNGVRVYPNNGAQVPRKVYGSENSMGYGMCAYEALMQGTDWWGYCD
jgi:hypothetical protein